MALFGISTYLFLLLGTVTIILCRVSADVTEDLVNILEEWGGVGLSAWSVDAQGHLCFLFDAGERIKGSGEPLVTTGDSRQHVGSITKSMTATLVAILIEDGLIENGWDATMEDLLPDLAQDTEYSAVTLRQLAGMMSGIRDQPSDMLQILTENPDLFTDLDFADLRSFRRAVAIAALRSTPVNKPGTAFSYSSWGYILLGHIIEELTGQTWEEVLSSRLFTPLGINLGTDPESFTGAATGENDPWGHFGDQQVPCDPSQQDCDVFAVAAPAGTFSGPVAATARYFAWHMHCHNNFATEESFRQILTQQSCQELHQPVDSSVSSYGYGWYCDDDGNGFACEHDGSSGLNHFKVLISLEMERAIVAFTNGANRSNAEDYWLVQEAVSAMRMLNDQPECAARIPSSFYLDGDGSDSPLPDMETRAPSTAPTVALTTSPSFAPTFVPSLRPSLQPIFLPTSSPTPDPTATPITRLNSEIPSAFPTIGSTPSPSLAPFVFKFNNLTPVPTVNNIVDESAPPLDDTATSGTSYWRPRFIALSFFFRAAFIIVYL